MHVLITIFFFQMLWGVGSCSSNTCLEHRCLNPPAAAQCLHLGHPRDSWKQQGLLSRDVHREVKHKLQTRGFINTEEDHSIKWEELEDLEELGKSEGE